MSISPLAFMDLDYYNLRSESEIDNDSSNPTYVNLESAINFVSSMFFMITDRYLKARDFSPYPDEEPEEDEEFVEKYAPDYCIFDGKSGTVLLLPTYPVNSISELKISGTVVEQAAADDFTSLNKFYLYKKKGQILYYGGFNVGNIQNVWVTWNGGYTSSMHEYDHIRNLEYSWVEKIIEEGLEIDSNIISESLGSYKYQKGNIKEMAESFYIPPFVYNSIYRFRRVPIG